MENGWIDSGFEFCTSDTVLCIIEYVATWRHLQRCGWLFGDIPGHIDSIRIINEDKGSVRYGGKGVL